MNLSVAVLIADDHPLMRSGVRAALTPAGVNVVAEAADASEMLELCEKHQPSVLIMDINMPGPTFLERVETVRRVSESTRILVLTAFDDAVYARAAFKAGVAGYVLKDEVAETLLTALRAVAEGGSYFSRRVLSKLREFDYQAEALSELTAREREVLTLVAAGLDNSAISERLSLAEQTTRNYVSRLYEKTGLSSRVALAVWALEHGSSED